MYKSFSTTSNSNCFSLSLFRTSDCQHQPPPHPTPPPRTLQHSSLPVHSLSVYNSSRHPNSFHILAVFYPLSLSLHRSLQLLASPANALCLTGPLFPMQLSNHENTKSTRSYKLLPTVYINSTSCNSYKLLSCDLGRKGYY